MNVAEIFRASVKNLHIMMPIVASFVIIKNSLIGFNNCSTLSLTFPIINLFLELILWPKTKQSSLECFSISFFQFILRLFIPQMIKQCSICFLYLSSSAK